MLPSSSLPETITSSFGSRPDRWSEIREEFLHRLSVDQRQSAVVMLSQPHVGGRGLRLWLHRLAVEDRPLPTHIPANLVQVYLDFNDAEPLHDCSECGLAIPVNPNLLSIDGEPDHVYFTQCPCCGSPTGLHAYWSRVAEALPGTTRTRPSKPR